MGETLVVPRLGAGEQVWRHGQVNVCCTTDDDVHSVAAVGGEPTVGIHVYGGDIGTLRRRIHDPATGAVSWFVSGWDLGSDSGPGTLFRWPKGDWDGVNARY